MGRVQPRDNGTQDSQGLTDRHRALSFEHREQVLTLDEGHGDVLDALDFAEIVDPDHVLVGHLSGQQELALEPSVELLGDRPVLRHLRPDHLEGDRDVQLAVPRLVDRPHAAEAEQLVDPVAVAERLPDLERAGGAGKREILRRLGRHATAALGKRCGIDIDGRVELAGADE